MLEDAAEARVLPSLPVTGSWVPVQMGAKTKMGLVMMGSHDTRHDMREEGGAMMEGYDNVVTVRAIEQTDLVLLQAIRNLKVEEQACSYASGLVVALDLLVKMEGMSKQDKGLVIVSNGKTEFDEDDLTFIDHVKQQMLQRDLRMTLYGINFHEDEGMRSRSENVLRDLVTHVKGELKVVSRETGCDAAAVKSVNPVTVYRGDLEFSSNIRIKVWAYPATKKVTLPSLKKRPRPRSGADDSAYSGEQKIYIDRRIVLESDPETEVKSEDITSGFKYGRKLVPLDEDDIQTMKYRGAKGLRFLGVLDRDKIPQHYLMGEASIIVPDRDQPQPSGKMMSAIVVALEDNKQVAVVNWVRRANDPPKLYGLFPYINKEARIYAFHAVQLPFADDLRHHTLGSLDQMGKKPLPEQLDIARTMIDKAALHDGYGNLFLQSESRPNPGIQNFYRKIRNKACASSTNAPASSFKDTLQELKPSHEIWSQDAQEQVRRAVESFRVEWKPEDAGTADTPANGSAGDGQSNGITGEVAPKRQRAGDAKAEVKVEVKKEESLDILFVAKGDNAEGTHDTATQFDSLWKRDPEEAIPYMKEQISALVDKSTTDRHVAKAVEYLQYLRQRCETGNYDEPRLFNEVWEGFERKYLNDSSKFWEKVLSAGLHAIQDEPQSGLPDLSDAAAPNSVQDSVQADDNSGDDFD